MIYFFQTISFVVIVKQTITFSWSLSNVKLSQASRTQETWLKNQRFKRSMPTNLTSACIIGNNVGIHLQFKHCARRESAWNVTYTTGCIPLLFGRPTYYKVSANIGGVPRDEKGGTERQLKLIVWPIIRLCS